jgi:hypothetical protein
MYVLSAPKAAKHLTFRLIYTGNAQALFVVKERANTNRVKQLHEDRLLSFGEGCGAHCVDSLCVVDDPNVTALTLHVNKKKPSGVFFLKMVEIKKKKTASTEP